MRHERKKPPRSRLLFAQTMEGLQMSAARRLLLRLHDPEAPMPSRRLSRRRRLGRRCGKNRTLGSMNLSKPEKQQWHTSLGLSDR